MATRNGKIANLPNDIREQLNLRLLEGETGRELVAWLNALPGVQSVLSSQFNGAPISEVNLTHWRQGGYLQWLTERECFDSARALAEADCGVDAIGLSAERLLNVLTVRFGQLLMQWDLPCDASESQSVAFSQFAKKARILQGISRSLLAIHRIQSQSPRQKSASGTSSPHSRAASEAIATPSLHGEAPLPQSPKKQASQSDESSDRGLHGGGNGKGRGTPPILSGPIAPASILSNRSETPFKPDISLSEILATV